MYGCVVDSAKVVEVLCQLPAPDHVFDLGNMNVLVFHTSDGALTIHHSVESKSLLMAETEALLKKYNQ